MLTLSFWSWVLPDFHSLNNLRSIYAWYVYFLDAPYVSKYWAMENAVENMISIKFIAMDK